MQFVIGFANGLNNNKMFIISISYYQTFQVQSSYLCETVWANQIFQKFLVSGLLAPAFG